MNKERNHYQKLSFQVALPILHAMFFGTLAALVPPPRLNLTRFFGVFAPNSKVRAEVTASQRGKNSPRLTDNLKITHKPYHARSMNWTQRLKRVFNTGITQCEACEQYNVESIACITDPAVLGKILAHLDKLSGKLGDTRLSILPPLRAPSIDQDFKIQRDFDWGA